jgi:hypothetical protein
MNKVVSSYATIRKECVMRISVFIMFVPKIIDMKYARKRIKHGLLVQSGIISSQVTVKRKLGRALLQL